MMLPQSSTNDASSAFVVVGTWIGSLFGYLPIAAAVLVSFVGFVYYVLMITSHPTITTRLRDRRERRIITLKMKLLREQISMAQNANGDHEFWETIIKDSQRTLASLQEHHEHRDLRHREEVVVAREHALNHREGELRRRESAK